MIEILWNHEEPKFIRVNIGSFVTYHNAPTKMRGRITRIQENKEGWLITIKENDDEWIGEVEDYAKYFTYE